ncbi:MAG: peptidase M48 [Deltaproteobacteria bacterium RBG_13_52_11]|nr:MAG: peptidase M48 [Deltaproteobacteria bacterium RBG_13_52_11]
MSNRARNYNIVYTLCRLLTVFILCFSLAACATVPLTERKSLRLIPDAELLSLSDQEYTKVLHESKLSIDQQKVQAVTRVGKRIASAAEGFLKDAKEENKLKNYQWEFNVIEDSKTANAWCMPGGKVAVYTGILPFTRTDAGLAVVLGHEVAHAIAEHGNERMSEALLTQLGGVALSVALENQPNETRQIFMAAYGVTANVGVLLPYSRLHESEADRIGLTLMARAGYDPHEAIRFWQTMSEQGGSRPPELLSTHPAPESRIDKIKSYIPEAMRSYKGKK